MAAKHYHSQNILPKEFFLGKLFDFRFFKKIPVFIFRFSHNLIWWPLRLIFSFFADFKVESKTNPSKLKGPLIVVANHSSWIDPFLISNAFPFRAKIHPIRYACWHRYYYSLRNYFFVRLLGAFPIKKRVGLEQSLKIPSQILGDKGVVGIFPEGRRFHRGRRRKGRRGAAFLALRTKTKILPVKIEEPVNMKFSQAFLRRYKIKIKIGRPFCLHHTYPQKITKPEDLNEATNLIIQQIREL